MTKPGLSTFDIAGRAMAAQLVRMNAIASNLANAGTISGTEAGAYRALRPVFRAAYDGQAATVDVARMARAGTPEKRLDPNHPLADATGHVWAAAVDSNQEMVEMVETARAYANNVEVMSTARGLMLDTLRIGK
ncbi:flagellar basal body rod protein FlgC [Sandarakinorhabdus oryzae]|uniref:flagellar basal body rod protein FlgC n=1 Tax=Sandarakinorhabdus oryzae TaxID=2675220 RepID=UPI0012E3230E|nr:flagellar basal body rod protein FlgC [Sandarakinorhabdus oryzae]